MEKIFFYKYNKTEKKIQTQKVCKQHRNTSRLLLMESELVNA